MTSKPNDEYEYEIEDLKQRIEYLELLRAEDGTPTNTERRKPQSIEWAGDPNSIGAINRIGEPT